ncbi:FliI/YscN family ATPase [Sphingopyxis sp.]|uniref:FliI/YscN family ATPase n=1 Tax=Sphingopyxis sp. TaxID=1908224 RepID=UPI002FC6A745
MTRHHHPALDMIRHTELVAYTGGISAIGQNGLEALGPLCSVGEFCAVATDGGDTILAQVVSVDDRKIRLLPLGPTDGIRIGAEVVRAIERSRLTGGDAFAGRAVDAFGEPIDGKGPLATVAGGASVAGKPGKLDRTIVAERVSTGIRAVDGLIPIAKGQRIGIFAASGVGKTTLVEQMSGRVDCDHCILCLIGERGREVERLWRMHLEGEGGDRFTLVAATSDESATARVRALDQALAIAEEWRAQGRHVVLFVDSVTRLAMALREIGLAGGEPPTLRSYTPNVFAAMPHYVERCGADRRAGQITAIFTVLAESDDVEDPIVELMKSLLDGHIILSRRLAEKGHFPPINIGGSVSRVADQVMPPATLDAARVIRQYFAEYDDARPMIESGIYRTGSSADIDRAIRLQPHITEFLRQNSEEVATLADTDGAMRQILAMAR